MFDLGVHLSILFNLYLSLQIFIIKLNSSTRSVGKVVFLRTLSVVASVVGCAAGNMTESVWTLFMRL